MPRRRRPQDKVDHLLDELLADYSTPEQILGEQGLLKQLTKRLVERALQAELSHHLETEVQAPPPEETSSSKRRNSRNGYSSKTVKADCGELALSIPRDRNSTFEPILVPKGERRLSGLDDKIMAMYARGLSTRDIQAQLEELYGVEVSPTLISQVTRCGQ
ncbi:Transposase, Mutator family [Leptolyngbya sp. O-77]|nr:Transposase, Mutator family [Leptolyngbya sp. O-77]